MPNADHPHPCRFQAAIDEIVERFRSGNLELAKTDRCNNNRISQLTTIMERYKAAAKLSRDWTKCNQLIQELESEIERSE